MYKKFFLASALIFASSAASADNFMDAAWAKKACDAWNQNTTLTGELGGADSWAANDNGRGYKIIQMYRTACGANTKVQMNIENKDGEARCAYGGVPDGKEINSKYDYIMHAKDKNWGRMGSGKDGPMKAMMLNRLKFKGPKGEAMGVMGPFGAFLKLAGSVPGEKGENSCPVPPPPAPAESAPATPAPAE